MSPAYDAVSEHKDEDELLLPDYLWIFDLRCYS